MGLLNKPLMLNLRILLGQSFGWIGCVVSLLAACFLGTTAQYAQSTTRRRSDTHHGHALHVMCVDMPRTERRTLLHAPRSDLYQESTSEESFEYVTPNNSSTDSDQRLTINS